MRSLSSVARHSCGEPLTFVTENGVTFELCDPCHYKGPVSRRLGQPGEFRELSLFDVVVDVPDIRVEAPSAPGSESSRRAARAIDPHRKGQHRSILLALAALHEPVPRERLSEITGIKESSLCARLSELAGLWVEVVHDACTASSGLTVDGYRCTAHGRARVTAQESAA